MVSVVGGGPGRVLFDLGPASPASGAASHSQDKLCQCRKY